MKSVFAILFLCFSVPHFAGNTLYGVDKYINKSPIGGGVGYRAVVINPTYTVSNKFDLIDMLQISVSGDVVYVADTAQIDLTGENNIVIPAGVTLASGRGNGSSVGALLFTNELNTVPLFKSGGDNVRVTGLRLRGPDPERRTAQMIALLAMVPSQYYSIPNSRGIYTEHSNLEVDNNDISGWSHAAIALYPGARNAHIHHNYIHHNQRHGLGYGVVHFRATSLIEANIFDWNRHAIAATGMPEDSYVARYNYVLNNANSHAFDMHGQLQSNGTYQAGNYVKIHHNTFFLADQLAVRVRGKSIQTSKIYKNCFTHQSNAVQQVNTLGNFKVFKNKYGGCL